MRVIQLVVLITVNIGVMHTVFLMNARLSFPKRKSLQRKNYLTSSCRKNSLWNKGRTSIQGQALYVRSARQTAQTIESPGCFASLRSVQGATLLAPSAILKEKSPHDFSYGDFSVL